MRALIRIAITGISLSSRFAYISRDALIPLEARTAARRRVRPHYSRRGAAGGLRTTTARFLDAHDDDSGWTSSRSSDISFEVISHSRAYFGTSSSGHYADARMSYRRRRQLQFLRAFAAPGLSVVRRWSRHDTAHDSGDDDAV